jgi:hypothetical protein
MITHNKWGTTEYWSWAMMKQRCLNPKNTSYSYYGGRGIDICERWLKFENFIEDMGPKPSPSHSIDRIDSNGNYESSNCRWATKLEQSLNRGINKNNTSGIKGVSKKGNRWRAFAMVKGVQINLGSYIEKNDAIKARSNYETNH